MYSTADKHQPYIHEVLCVHTWDQLCTASTFRHSFTGAVDFETFGVYRPRFG